MSIKTSIFLFLLMMGFSFSANATQLYEITDPYKVYVDSSSCSLKKGLVVTKSYCVGSTWTYRGQEFKVNSVSIDSYGKFKFYDSEKGKLGYYGITRPVSTCPSGTAFNPITNKCDTVCTPPAVLNPATNECYTPPFCERQSTIDELFAAEQSCAEQLGIFTHECSDFLDSLETRCTQTDECAIGFPNWPACMEDLDPTDNITPPSGGFNPGSGPTANPDGPTFDKPEPDDVTPTDTTDEAVLKAVQNANRDSNEGFKALSTDLNNGFTDTNNALSKLNSTNTAIGESVVEQMNQDYKIFQANKDLSLQQTGAITSGTSRLTDAIGEQTGSLTGAIGEQTGALTDAIGELASKLPEQCVPDATNNWCENPHGLDASYIGDVFTQMDVVTNETIHNNNGLIEGFVQDVIDSSLTTENESIMNNSTNVLLNALGFNESCSPLTFEANGKNYSIGCEVSEKIKLVLSFLIGMYTLMTLTDILLDGITPLGRKPSATRFA